VKKLLRRVILGVVAGVAVYGGFSVWAGARTIGERLATFAWGAAVLALGLASVNYVVRFVRWHYYLRVLGLKVPPGESLLVFLGGFALTVTPGKLGEVLKSFLLRESRGIPAARTAPIVVAERFTDLVGLLALAAVGALTFPIPPGFLIAAGLMIAVGLVVISVEPLARAMLALVGRLPGGRRLSPKLDELYGTTATLLRPGPLLLAVLLSIGAWMCECLAFWLVVRGFPGASIGLQAATTIYAAGTIAGALVFLPGGLGVTEAGMLTLLVSLGRGIDVPLATAATFITRLCTLWFAVIVGLVALTLFARRTHVAVELPAGEPARQA
jgi:uncharacterized protein (TIRG00374 family)